MTSQRGVALILALMVLAFLTVLGGALLTTTTIEATVRRPGINVNDPGLVARIGSNATDVFNPISGTAQIVTNCGSPANYRIAVVNGDADLTGGNGYGILLVRGNVNVTGNI